jgi:hypothetical protein
MKNVNIFMSTFVVFYPKELPDWFDFYNSKVVLAFFGIEKNGLKINKYEFDKHYELNHENFILSKMIEYLHQLQFGYNNP